MTSVSSAPKNQDNKAIKKDEIDKLQFKRKNLLKLTTEEKLEIKKVEDPLKI